MDHTYYDHVSILKFIEKNWGLSPVTGYGRDNLPNPTAGPTLYVPGNQPAIGDLTNMFSFKNVEFDRRKIGASQRLRH